MGRDSLYRMACTPNCWRAITVGLPTLLLVLLVLLPPCGSGSSTLPLSRPPDRCMVAAWMPVTETHLKLYSCHRSCSSRPCLPASLFVRHIPGYISRSFPTFKDEDDDDGDGDRQYLAALLFPAASTNYRGLLAPPASPAAVVSFNGTTRRTFSPLSISHVRSTI